MSSSIQTLWGFALILHPGKCSNWLVDAVVCWHPSSPIVNAMGCHLTSAITRSSHELLSRVKYIGTPHTSHCPPPPKTNRASGENNSRDDDSFSVFSGLMTCPLPNSSVFHPHQSLEGIMDDSAGEKKPGLQKYQSHFTDAGCNFELDFFFTSDLLLSELIFFFYSVEEWKLQAVWLFSTFELWLLTGFDAHFYCFTIPNQLQVQKKTSNYVWMINCYWQHSEISFARTPIPWTSH